VNIHERNLVKTVAQLTPWLAPLPSGYFVARSAMKHLEIPFGVALIIGITIEFLGLASVYVWLWLSDWNNSKRKSDPMAPVGVGVMLGLVYLITTIGLTVILEVRPNLSTYAPALFPVLAVVGAINLALISQQEHREKVVYFERLERKTLHQTRRPDNVKIVSPALSNSGNIHTLLDMANQARKKNRQVALDTLVDLKAEQPDLGVTEMARRIGRSRQTVYTYLDMLEKEGWKKGNGSKPLA